MQLDVHSQLSVMSVSFSDVSQNRSKVYNKTPFDVELLNRRPLSMFHT